MAASRTQPKRRSEATLTFGAEKRGGAVQELSDLLQRALLPAVDAGLRVVAIRRGGDLIADDREPRLVWKILQTAAVQTSRCSLRGPCRLTVHRQRRGRIENTSHVNPTPTGTRTMYCSTSFGKGEPFTHVHNKMYEEKASGLKIFEFFLK